MYDKMVAFFHYVFHLFPAGICVSLYTTAVIITRYDEANCVYNNHRGKLRFSWRKFMCPGRANGSYFCKGNIWRMRGGRLFCRKSHQQMRSKRMKLYFIFMSVLTSKELRVRITFYCLPRETYTGGEISNIRARFVRITPGNGLKIHPAIS